MLTNRSFRARTGELVLPRASSAEGRFRAAVAAAFVGLALLLVWNVFHYDWLRGYDAWHNALYVDTLRFEHRLPTRAESGSSHNPPLFFGAAVVIESVADLAGWPDEPRILVQLASAAAAFGVVLLAFLIARELFPRSRTVQVTTLVFAALAPVLARTGVMYHYEALGALFATAAVYVYVRAWVRGRAGLREGAIVGALLGLALLTRASTLAVLGGLGCAVLLALRGDQRRDAARMGIATVATAIGLAMPWFVYQQVEHGGAFDMSREAPAGPLLERRPAAFYTDLALRDVFHEPYAPHFLNRLVPVVYADWWGDYWRYYGVPATMINDPPRLPEPHHSARVRQSYVGVLPTLLIVAGLGLIAWTALRGRSTALAAVPATAVALGLAYVYYQQRYAYHDGDTLKATYLLSALAPVSVAAGVAMERLRRTSRLLFAGVALALAAAAVVDLRFLILDR
jgi:4-amino-4-deoxy-L-arabinose transferase-like glycosyltransferase